MLTVFRKEINLFFSSLIGYIAIISFLLITALFVWVFPEYSVLTFGYSSLESFFGLAPFIFMFLIPAVTMRSFSEEISTGTIELLVTKPISDLQIIIGKYLAAMLLVLFALIPTILYYYSVYQLGTPVGNIDSGGYWGSFLGLIMLASAFVAIGVFSSSVTGNQIVAFILGVFLCFIFYMSFDLIAGIPLFFGNLDYFIEQLGINAHYNSISRGILDTRDLLYFISITALFILFTKTALESRKW